LKYLPLIPARGGSKGIPGKNIRECAGEPLIAWTIDAALKAMGVAYVSTDDEEIADVAWQLGAKIIERPAILAADNSPTEDAVLHALGKVGADAVVLLQPTSPTRTSWQIQQARDQFERYGYDSLLSVHAIRGHCLWELTPELGYRPLYKTRVMRQKAPLYLVENGALYISKAWCYVEKGNRLAGKIGHYVMPHECPEIDTYSDLTRVAEILEKYHSIDKRWS